MAPKIVISKSKVSQHIHPDVQSEAALAVMASKYAVPQCDPIPEIGKFAKYFELIRAGESEAEWTKQDLTAAMTLRPAIKYYTEMLSFQLLQLPLFMETRNSKIFGPLPPTTDLDLRRFQCLLYRFQAQCEVLRQSVCGALYPVFHYEVERNKVTPYSDIQLDQVEMMKTLFRYRMLDVCKDHLDKRDIRDPHNEPRGDRYYGLIDGIICQGLPFMHSLEMKTTYKAREKLISKIEKRPWVGFHNMVVANGQEWEERRSLKASLEEAARATLSASRKAQTKSTNSNV